MHNIFRQPAAVHVILPTRTVCIFAQCCIATDCSAAGYKDTPCCWTDTIIADMMLLTHCIADGIMHLRVSVFSVMVGMPCSGAQQLVPYPGLVEQLAL